MNIKINKENIKRFTAGVVLAAVVGTPVGLVIGCKKTDHSKELCPVTKLLNMLPNYKNAELDYEIPRGAEHQLTHLAADYYSEEYGEDTNEEEKLIVGSIYGQITYTEEFHKIYENGIEEVYTNEYSKGENGITTYYSDGTKDSLVFETKDISEPELDFQLKKVINHNR